MGTLTREEAVAHAQGIVAATPLPVNGDFENGFGDDPDTVAETVRLAAEAGLSGCGIEDTQMVPGNPAYPFDLAVERIQAAVAAGRALDRPFVLTARADGVMNGAYDLAEGLRRLQAFEAAGAECLYLPVPPGRAELAQILASVGKPVNALLAGPLRTLPMSELAQIGVRRLSLGSQMARVTHAAIHDVMTGVLGGDFAGLRAAARGDVIDALLEKGANPDG